MAQSSISLLRVYLRPYHRRLLILLLLILVGISLQLFAPQIIRQFLDAAQAGAATRLLVQMGLLFLLATLLQKGAALAATYFGEDLGWAATNRLRVDLTRHCIRLDMGFHKLRTPGELIQRIDGDVTALAEYFSQLFVQVFGNTLLILGILFLLFREDWRFGLIGLAYGLFTLGFLRLIQTPTVKIWNGIRQGYAEMFGFLEERFNGTEDIRANGGSAYVLNKYYPMHANIARKRVRATLYGGFTFSSSQMLHILALAATLGLAGFAYLQNQISIGTVFLLAFYIDLMESPISRIRRQVANMQRAMASVNRINEFFQIQPDVPEAARQTLPPAAPTVRFHNVIFAYKDRLSVNGKQSSVNGKLITDHRLPITTQTVLHDITFTLPANHTLGVLGRTGSGKTTLTRLLFRLYDVDTGAITLDSIDVRDVALSDLRQRVGMVTQEVQLFAASIRDNLTLFRNYDDTAVPISDADIHQAIHTLGLDAWLAGLPDGLDTMLKSGGKGLSAGEAQLLAFTRVFLRDPHLIILDEASSRLDPATEQLLERAIDRLLQNRTAIIIAHRLQTVQRADDILILANGRIAEHGPRIQLAAEPGSRFSQLLQTGFEEALA